MSALAPIAPPHLYAPRPVRVWVIIGFFVVYLACSFAVFFYAIAPVANFSIQPAIAADSAAYWDASGVRTTNFAEQQYEGASAGGNLFGPVLQAMLFRSDLGVALCNCGFFLLALWALHGTPEFDRATFLLLMMANPFLLASLITLNKEIFALTGIVLFVRYTAAKRFRLLWLAPALIFSLMARWQQLLVLLLYLAYESRFSPLRGRRRWGIAVTLLGFTVAYALVVRLVPSVFVDLLAQASAGHTIVILDNIQAKFGFPLVVIPKIMMNCMGLFITPMYFITSYFTQDFSNWRDAFITNLHCLTLSILLFTMVLTRRLKLRHAPVYLLALYLLMTAINPMVQPRYEYAAYVLLCLEASRYFRLGDERQPAPSPAAARLSPATR